MAIRFEYGPPQSALGALAYQAGAAEAADRRRREIEQMQMQAAQMRQQQQQNALNRQFDAWKTQYSHHSALDKMQKDFKWREEQAEIGRDHEKRMFGLKNERGDFEWERDSVNRREMWELENAARTRRDLAKAKSDSERLAKEYELRGKHDEAAAERRKAEITEERLFNGLKVEKQDEVLKLRSKIQAVDANRNLMPQPLEEQSDPKKASEAEQQKQELQKQIDAIYADPSNKKPSTDREGGAEDHGVIRKRRINGKVEKSIAAGATAKEVEKEIGITGHSDKEHPYILDGKRVYDAVILDPMSEDGYRIVQRGLPGKSPEEKQKDALAREKAINDAYNNLLTDDDVGGTVLSARGRAIAVSQGKNPDEINKSKDFDSVIIGHVNTIHKPEKADPDLDDQAALGGRPFFTENTEALEGIGGQPGPQGQAGAEGIAAKVNANVQVNTQEAIEAKARADQVAGRTAESLRPDYELAMMADWDTEQAMKDAWDIPFWEGAELTPEGYGLNDPDIDESERQRRQKAYSEALTRRGRGDRTAHWEPGSFEARHDPDVTKRPKGWPVNRTPEVGAEALEKVLGKVEESTAGQALATSSKKTRSSLAALSRAVRETSGKGPSVGVRSNKKDPKSKYQKDRAKDRRDKTYEIMKKGTPGERVPMTRVYSSISGRYDPVGPKNITRANRDEYNKFQKELRNYTHRLLNNKDASKDAKIRLDRIIADLPKMSKADLDDEIRVLKVLGRSANAKDPSFFDKNPVWKDFVSGEKTELDKLLGISMTPQGRPKWTAKSVRSRGKYNPVVMKRMARELHESLKKAGF